MEFLTGTAVLEAVADLLRPGRRRARVAVAYVGRDATDILTLQAGDLIVINGSDSAVLSGATDPRAVEYWLAAGIQVVNHPWLHAKVFVAGRTAIVGSANASERARSGRIIEAAIRTTDSATVAAVRQFIEDLAFRSFGQDIDEEWVKSAKRRFPTTPLPPPWEPTPPPLTGPFRLWLGWWDEPYEMKQAEHVAYAESVAALPPVYRRRARYEPEGRVEYSVIKDFFQRGDMVIMLTPRSARLVQFWGARPIRRGRSDSLMALYLRDRRLKPVATRKVREALEAAGFSLPERKEPDFGRWLEHPTERQAVLDLWGLRDFGVPRTDS